MPPAPSYGWGRDEVDSRRGLDSPTGRHRSEARSRAGTAGWHAQFRAGQSAGRRKWEWRQAFARGSGCEHRQGLYDQGRLSRRPRSLSLWWGPPDTCSKGSLRFRPGRARMQSRPSRSARSRCRWASPERVAGDFGGRCRRDRVGRRCAPSWRVRTNAGRASHSIGVSSRFTLASTGCSVLLIEAHERRAPPLPILLLYWPTPAAVCGLHLT